MSVAFGLGYTSFSRSARRLSRYCRHSSRRLIVAARSAPKRVVFLGTPQIAANVLKKLYAASKQSKPEYELCAVVTQPPASQGRKRVLTKSPVHIVAEQLGISPILTPVRAGEQDFIDSMTHVHPDLCITTAYGKFLPQKFLDLPKFGTLNIHPSLLPHYRGAAPVPRALEAGVEKTGVTILYTVLKMDAGPIVAVKERELDGSEQTPELLEELVDVGADTLLNVLPSIWEGSAQMCEQDDSQASHAPKLSKDEARLSFTENAILNHNKVRALAGWPGTWADFSVGESDNAEAIRLKIGKTTVLRREGGICFDIHDVSHDAEKNALVITCGDGSRLGLLTVQPPGKRLMDAGSFWNGLRGRPLQRKRLPY
ncbi:Methionyl-tRNA formyltransferase [Gracilariopsis chorda]|uniref:Methionyl-tRNA formyltransferase, mitochondrial n=1 Tax=Gracilariopsis chorda TaxID=448386 RepID=A0A2V3IHY5_9FLOR|nr:Methionyl-tRNA formyltransferase [Gracilariopsis chorda]|eukprot:PXF41648.1 Methionyl-tRNA formyltransferase [Gracilariopsis chorda]